MHAFSEIKTRPVARYIAAEQARFWPRISGDLRDAATLPGLALPRSRLRDAGVVLNSRLTWEGRAGVLRAGAPDETVDPAIVAALQKRGADWPSCDPALADALDFRWMTALRDFDHWDIRTPALALVADERSELSLPLPRLPGLQAWSKLRLLRGLRDDDLAGAVADVRQLADLLRSTETTLGAFLGTALQKLELDVRRSHGTRLGTPLGPPPVPDEEALEEERRLIWALGFWPVLLIPEELLAEQLLEVEASPLACLALAESSEFALRFRAGLGRTHGAAYALVRASVERQAERCGIEVVRGWWREDANWPVDILTVADESDLGLARWVARIPIPGVRAEVYEALLASVVPGGLSRYTRDHSRPEVPGPVTE